MRVPLSWLVEYVSLPAGDALGTVTDVLVRLGVEVSEIHRADLSGPLVIGRVLEIEDLTEFKKPIRYCQVDVGESQARGIVCGATNFAVGDLVVTALPGVVLPGGFAISARKTYDRISDGMICSTRELGLGDEHTGILVLSADLSAAPGAAAVTALGLDDPVFELEITPDRGDLLSVRGLAREIGLGLGVPSTDPGRVDPPLTSGPPSYEIRVEDTTGCDRFVGLVLTGLDPGAPSPAWLQRRLTQAGIRTVSLAVDVTNFVMVELGQPMHAFDLDLLTGPLVVRRGTAGEHLITLDGVQRNLSEADLLITDDTGPIGLAAVMGGRSTEIHDATTGLLLEAAHWDPVTVSRTSRGHGLFSEAARRFERGVDPEMTTAAIARAAQLLTQYGGAKPAGSVVDVDNRTLRAPVVLDVSLPSRVAGVDYSVEHVCDVLTRLGAAVVSGSHSGEVFEVLPPSWRMDLVDPHDVVEEIVRLSGYDQVPSVLPVAPAGRGLTAGQRRRRSIARSLADQGYVESPAYPFLDPAVFDALRLPDDDERRKALRLANPISETEPLMRTTLLPGLLKTLRRNLGRGQRDVALFEIGLVVRPTGEAARAPVLPVSSRPDDEQIAALKAAVPRQPWRVGLLAVGAAELSGWWGKGRPVDWTDVLAAVAEIGTAAGVRIRSSADEHAPWHPGRCAALLVMGTDGADLVIGHAGELHPGVCAAMDVPAGTVAAELELDLLPPSAAATAPILSAYPPVLLDLAVMVPADVPAAAVEAAIREGAGQLLDELRLFDDYSGAQVGQGQRSLAFALQFRAPDRTLTGTEATEARDAAVAEAHRRTGAVLRG
ncbi:MAG: phenylalanine--tRNA ligase subunit beta [Geodermatophilaceae bacterium]|jgi:phenylalanyl-tRNA synthetase beta chain|nr:phenylalanine--tRNA ligase subunit beta [Geodermatophilaceae bacterium]